MATRVQSWLPFMCVLWALGCSADLTEIVVVVDTDYAIDAELDRVLIDVEGLGEQPTVEVPLSGHPLPITLGLVNSGGALGPIAVRVSGQRAQVEVVSARRSEVYFVRRKTRMLRLDLLKVCDGMCVTGEQTCRAGVCGSSAIGADELLPWSTPQRLDAGGNAGVGGSAGADGGGGSSGGGGTGGDSGFDAGPDGGDPTMPLDAAVGPDGGDPTVPLCPAADCPAAESTGVRRFGFVPSNVVPADVTDDPASLPVVTLDCGAVSFDTTTRTATGWCSGQPMPTVVEASAATSPTPLVLAFQHLHVAAGTTLRLAGERPAIIVVFGDAWIDGAIDASGSGATPGAGGNVLCASSETGADGNNAPNGFSGGHGGGGGGFGSSGGGGGLGTSSGTLTTSGSASANVTLSPMRGGCAGGRGGTGSLNSLRAVGGGGGGAVQLSVAGVLYVRGVITAVGGGGRKAAPAASGDADGGNGGGGGGSGGAILLEAGAVRFASDAWLTANGGSGAAGLAQNVTVDGGSHGADGRKQAASAAPGGPGGTLAPGAIPRGGDGGDGAAASAGSQSGGNAPSGLSGLRGGGGGGGGGVGRIRINRAGTCQMPAQFSPAPVVALASGSACS